LPAVYYEMGVAQAGLRSSAASESFKKYIAIMEQADPHSMLDDARQKAAKK